MGAGRLDRDGSYVLTDWARYEPSKTKAMVCTPGFIWGKWEEFSFKRQETGEGANFRERKKTRVSCATCGVMVAESYLKAHMARGHGICAP